MKIIRKIFWFILAYNIFALLFAFLFTFFNKSSVSILPVFENSYTVNSVFLLFIDILPAMQLAGILIGFSWFFKDFTLETHILNTAVKTQIIRSISIVIIICLVISTVALEFIQPFLRSSQNQMQIKTADFKDLTSIAREYIFDRQFEKASPYIEQALAIDPTSQEALRFQRLIEDSLGKENEHVEQTVHENKIFTPIKGEKFEDFLLKARASYAKKNYIDAHYYATLAIENNDGTHSLQEIKQIAADAWNKISTVNSNASEKDSDLFSKKKQGYLFLLQNDYLAAYYLFNDLLKDFPNDPDVMRYAAEAKKLLTEAHFFIDETYNLQQFEKVRNVFFSVPRFEGGVDVVYIAGLTGVKSLSGFVQYVRGLQIIRFDEQKKFEMSLQVDYAKVIAEPITNFSSAIINNIKIESGENASIPVFQLVSVDRVNQGVINAPVYNRQTLDKEFFNTYILFMPYNDFLLVTEAADGAQNMSLSSLLRFVGKASKYGYSFEVFAQVLCYRLFMPLVILIITVFSIIFGWRYRLTSDAVIKFYWLLFTPFVAAFCYLIIQFASYVFTLVMYTFIALFKWYAGFIMLLFLIVIFVILLFVFILELNNEKS